MEIDNSVLLNFCNETIRPLADRLAILLPLLDTVPASVKGQDIPNILGTTSEELFRSSPWLENDYAKIEKQNILNSDSGGRVKLSNHDIINFIRIIASLSSMKQNNPSMSLLVGKIAVNPRV
jgi:hypothetical protein